MDIALNTAAPQRAAASPSGGLSSDFETFLKMLTVQMRNQDPLNPIEASDYAVQLATFSNVEQSVRTNELLSAIQQQFGVLNLSQTSGWIGQEARSAAPVHFNGAAVTLSAVPSDVADRAVLVVRNSSGEVISRDDFPLFAMEYVWRGQDITGGQLAPGLYNLSLESYAEDTLLGTGIVEHYALVREVRSGASGPRVVLDGGVEIGAEAVSALRMP